MKLIVLIGKSVVAVIPWQVCYQTVPIFAQLLTLYEYYTRNVLWKFLPQVIKFTILIEFITTDINYSVRCKLKIQK